MLVFLRGLGLESQEIMSRVVFIVRYLSVDRPEIGMYVEEIHIHRHLDAFPLKIFTLISFLDDDDLSVSYGRDGGGICHDIAVRNPVEPGHETAENGNDQYQEPCQGTEIDGLENNESEQRKHQPDHRYEFV